MTTPTKVRAALARVRARVRLPRPRAARGSAVAQLVELSGLAWVLGGVYQLFGSGVMMLVGGGLLVVLAQGIERERGKGAP